MFKCCMHIDMVKDNELQSCVSSRWNGLIGEIIFGPRRCKKENYDWRVGVLFINYN